MRPILLLICSAVLLAGCVARMAPQTTARLKKLEVHTADGETPESVNICVRYGGKGVTIDTQQCLTNPFCIKQPKSWGWIIIWPSVGIPITAFQSLDGFTVYAEGYRPQWCGWAILSKETASVRLAEDGRTSAAFAAFITNSIGKSTAVPKELKQYFNLGDNFIEEVRVQ
jgi:hypothetical protein